MSGTPNDLYAAAQALLAAAATALEVSAGGAITTQAIWPGPPSYDCCPALYVWSGSPIIGNTYPLQPPLESMQRSVTTGQVNLVSMTITVLRCAPTLDQRGQNVLLPDPALISAAAQQTMGDVWAIWNVLLGMHRNGTLFNAASGSNRREFEFDPAISLRTQGGAAGWEIPLKFQLPGFATP